MTESTAHTSPSPGDDFIRRLRSMKDDRAKMAALRRGLSPATIMDAWPVVASLGGDITKPQYMGIGPLFAIHPDESGDYSFGTTCRKIALPPDQHWSPEELSVNRFLPRFRRLVSSDAMPDLLVQLRYWIQFAHHSGIGVNYVSLFNDLRKWKWSRNDILVQWARDFFQAPRNPEVDKNRDPVEI